MFTHLLPSNDEVLLNVSFSNYAQRHFLKDFEKKYPERDWVITVESIVQDISRICVSSFSLQKTQQVDELWHKDDCWVFKYDFRVARTNVSTKSSGNRCVVYINLTEREAEVLMIYDKGRLPKKKSETAYIADVLKEEFADYWDSVR